MKQNILHHIKQLIRQTGFDIVRVDKDLTSKAPPDLDKDFLLLYEQVQPYTMTSRERIFALREAIKYVVSNKIPGDIVECGVWRGGSMMAAAHTLIQHGDTTRQLYLFDTFEGMPPPTDLDVSHTGQSAQELLEKSTKTQDDVIWAYAPFEQVQKNLGSTGYPQEKTVFVQGKVEDTLPEKAPTQIALLRLDTDWYNSTYHGLSTLYPRLVNGGVLIIDDYGWWQGARQAVDEYFAQAPMQPLLCRIDDTGRICVKVLHATNTNGNS